MKSDSEQRGIFPTILVFAVLAISSGIMLRWYQGMLPANLSDSIVASANASLPSLGDPYWKIVPEEDGERSVVRYIHASENSKNWTEQVFTVKSKIVKSDFTLKQAAFDIVSVVHHFCPKYKNFQDYGVTTEENGDVYFEWQISGCPVLRDRHEIVRIVQRGKTVYGVHYVTRDLPVLPEKQEEWRKILAAQEIPE